jgi:hypothetical protein
MNCPKCKRKMDQFTNAKYVNAYECSDPKCEIVIAVFTKPSQSTLVALDKVIDDAWLDEVGQYKKSRKK